MTRVPMTPQGYEKIRQELSHLKTVVRPQNIRDIEEARAHGDLSENAEYSAAKEKQSLIAGQIASLEDKLGRAEVIDPSTLTGNRVIFGAKVKVLDLDEDEEKIYQIVGDDEANVPHGLLGISSPIARGLLGKSAGDEAKIRTPKGERILEVVSICF